MGGADGTGKEWKKEKEKGNGSDRVASDADPVGREGPDEIGED